MIQCLQCSRLYIDRRTDRGSVMCLVAAEQGRLVAPIRHGPNCAPAAPNKALSLDKERDWIGRHSPVLDGGRPL